VSQTLQTSHLPTSLRALRVGLDDDVHIRRTLHLAAAKIEDLQEQVTRLVSALEATGQDGGGERLAAIQGGGPAHRNGNGDGRY